MSTSISAVDPDGLAEFSVVFTDRSLNHMSQRFQQVMRDISRVLRTLYNADGVALVPGGGTFGMEAVARQFGSGQRCLVVRNGFFSFRWSEIFAAGGIPSEEIVLKAAQLSDAPKAPFAPLPAAEVAARIRAERPALVCMPHVETASGILLPDDYLREVSAAVKDVGGLLVLDCIASGALWVDMRATGVDVLISAPQKGWSASPCAALVMLGERAMARLAQTRSTSFACDLARWQQIMAAYEQGGHAYHATLPTDALVTLRDAMLETEVFGFERARDQQWALGRAVRALLESKGLPSVAATGFQAPCVIVSYTDELDLHNTRRLMAEGVQTASGVPLQCDERPEFRTFRIGLFGLDKLSDVDGTVAVLTQALDSALAG